MEKRVLHIEKQLMLLPVEMKASFLNKRLMRSCKSCSAPDFNDQLTIIGLVFHIGELEQWG